MSRIRDHYGLQAEPFAPDPDPRYLVATRPIRAALSALRQRVEDNSRLIVVTGERGVGKSTLGNAFHRAIGGGSRVAKVVYPSGRWAELRDEIDDQLRLDSGPFSKEALQQESQAGRRVLVIFDQADRITEDTLSELEPYLALQSPDGSPIQFQLVLIVGPPSQAPLYSWLETRSPATIELEPLGEEETVRYIQRRLRMAAGDEREIMTEEAAAEVHTRSGGIPAAINELCTAALELGAERGSSFVAVGLVREADGERSGKRKVLSKDAQRQIEVWKQQVGLYKNTPAETTDNEIEDGNLDQTVERAFAPFVEQQSRSG
ncbi:MAG: AAA family ATPase, partial [Proteobacteria bacterium]|nr:AAA family ATPase [Pseudomonadota bacterium]